MDTLFNEAIESMRKYFQTNDFDKLKQLRLLSDDLIKVFLISLIVDC